MGMGQFFAGGDDDEKDKAQPSLAERTAQDWIKPGGGYEQYKKGDAAREKAMPVGTVLPRESAPKPGAKPKPSKRKSIGQMIAEG